MVAAGLGEGDEVITTSFTWPATTNAVLHAGATPVFADVDADTLNIDPDAVRALVGPRTRAVLPVHFAGGPCDMDALVRDRARALAAGDRGCRARGRGDGGRPQGGIDRDFTCFSLYATKSLAGGEGGVITTRSRRRRSGCGCCGRRASRAIRGAGSCRAASGTTT
jgi:dTDP-4-amino-4,6-dideoxygalactose transaminase